MNRIQIRFIQQAVKNQHRLDQWEIDFINRMNELTTSTCAEHVGGYELSKKENKILNQIQRKVY